MGRLSKQCYERLFLILHKVVYIVPSRVSGRGYKIGPVCVSVCLSVSLRSHGWTVWHADPKFGRGLDLDNISDEFEDQGHRSKVKVARLKNVIFEVSDGWITQNQFVMTPDVMWHHVTTSWRHMTSWYDVMMSRHDVLTSVDDFWARILTKRAPRGRARQRSGVFIISTSVWFLCPLAFDISKSALSEQCSRMQFTGP